MLKKYITLLRVPQWIKNTIIFVPLLFSHNLFELHFLNKTIVGFFIFCLTSSIVYIINDINDIEADRLHPVKKKRPLAAGSLSFKSAFITIGILSVPVLISLPYLEIKFVLFLLIYFLLNVLYSVLLKHIVILDIFLIAAGFMIRVISGAFIIDVEISSWLILTTMFLSLFLAATKRHSELKLSDEQSTSTRKVLSEYSTYLTGQMATVAATAVVICYALYTVSERTVKIFGNENLIYTTPFVVFGIFRFMYLVYKNSEGEDTTQTMILMINDIPMMLTLILYVLTSVTIIYDLL
jgi:4-hydroxybenzoate polyprenyltransferase